MVIWVTGLSAAGKTTLCQAIRDIAKPSLPELVLIDGDVIRATFGHDLTHTESDRVIQVRRVQGLAKALSEQGLYVIVAVLYAHPDLLAWNRVNLPNYFEVYLKVSLEAAMARDPRSLYRRALDGNMNNVVGMDIPWRAPMNPDLVLDVDSPEAPNVLARRVIAAVPGFAERARLTP